MAIASCKASHPLLLFLAYGALSQWFEGAILLFVSNSCIDGSCSSDVSSRPQPLSCFYLTEFSQHGQYGCGGSHYHLDDENGNTKLG